MIIRSLFGLHSTGMTMNERFTHLEHQAVTESVRRKREDAMVERWARTGGAHFAKIALAVLRDAHISWPGVDLIKFKRLIKQKYANGKGVEELTRMFNSSQGTSLQFGNNSVESRIGINNGTQRRQVAKRSRPYRGQRGIVFRGIGFRGIGFRGIGFRGIGFRGIGFRGIGFRGTGPSRVGLRGARVRGTGLRGNHVRGAGLLGTGQVLRNFGAGEQVGWQKRKQTARRGRPLRRGRGGLNQGGMTRQSLAQSKISREQLDKELDEYMATSRAVLDKQLDDYMAEADTQIEIVG